MYCLYVLEKLAQAEKDVQEGRVVSQQTLREEIAGWIAPALNDL